MEGMLLKRRAKEMISLAEKTRQELAQKDAHLTGEISIGCGELQSVDFLSRLLARFQAENPLVRFAIYSGNADSIKERIENGLLDMGLLPEPVDMTKYAFLHVPQKETWGVLVHKDSKLAEKQAICPADLLDSPLMISNRDLVQDFIADWFGVPFDDLHIVCRYNLPYNAAIMVRNKIGAAICIKLDCSYADTCFIPFSPPVESGSVLYGRKFR